MQDNKEQGALKEDFLNYEAAPNRESWDKVWERISPEKNRRKKAFIIFFGLTLVSSASWFITTVVPDTETQIGILAKQSEVTYQNTHFIPQTQTTFEAVKTIDNETTKSGFANANSSSESNENQTQRKTSQSKENNSKKHSEAQKQEYNPTNVTENHSKNHEPSNSFLSVMKKMNPLPFSLIQNENQTLVLRLNEQGDTSKKYHRNKWEIGIISQFSSCLGCRTSEPFTVPVLYTDSFSPSFDAEQLYNPGTKIQYTNFRTLQFGIRTKYNINKFIGIKTGFDYMLLQALYTTNDTQTNKSKLRGLEIPLLIDLSFPVKPRLYINLGMGAAINQLEFGSDFQSLLVAETGASYYLSEHLKLSLVLNSRYQLHNNNFFFNEMFRNKFWLGGGLGLYYVF